MEIKKLLVGANPYEKSVEKIDRERAEAATKARKAEATGDKVAISEDAALRSVAVRAAMAEPDARAEKIAALKAQIQNGTYEPDNKKIAEGIVREDLSIFLQS